MSLWQFLKLPLDSEVFNLNFKFFRGIAKMLPLGIFMGPPS
jgi:hypothetical protein